MPTLLKNMKFNYMGLGAPILVMAMLTMIVIPLPPFMLDILFTFNIALSLVILFAGIYAKRPLDFAVFPTLLLMATLLRLALNIASTRIVLLEGHTGTAAAGKVIEAFGSFVVGGNYAVGLVIFSILVIINFVVVTKGAGRISEVSARFTLDAMPGKQMAIDADLNAGVITQEDAMERRSEVVQEADFYGSMDGASKFVRGDAVAGILILFITVIGGIAVGMLQHDMAFGAAVENYTLLTIGDGLVAQIPSLVLSTSAAIMVTRVSSEQDMGEQIRGQLFFTPKSLAVPSAIIGIVGLVPGMPFIFIFIAAIGGVLSYYLHIGQQKEAMDEVAEEAIAVAPEQTEKSDLSWDDVLPLDKIGLEVGYRLIPMVDKNQGGQLLARIKGIRKKLTMDLGFLISAVHIRDNLDLAPNVYRILLKGVEAGSAEIYPDRELAINPGQVFGTVQGVKTKDPSFGMEAYWIDPGQRDQAQTMGYTVVDASTVIATHISQTLVKHSHELLGIEDTQTLLDNVAKISPKLIEGLVPDELPLSTIHKVLQNLLQEQVSIRDISTIIETLASHAMNTKEPEQLTALVRVAMGRSIVHQIYGSDEELSVITLAPSLEQILQEALQADSENAVIEPGLAERIFQSLNEVSQSQEVIGGNLVLLVAPALRSYLRKFVSHGIQNMHVLSFNEVPGDKRIKVIANIGG